MKRSTQSILCIGNDPVRLNLRCSLLKEAGWRVLSAVTGHDGLLQFERDKVGAIILDLGGDGSEAALITGALKVKRPAIPVIILVGEEDILAQGATEQADAVLQKEREKDRLVDLINNLRAEPPPARRARKPP